MNKLIFLLLTICMVSGCSQTTPSSTPPANTTTPILKSFQPDEPTAGMTPVPQNTQTPVPLPTATLAPDAWKEMPVFPDHLSPKMVDVYKLGQSLGNNPHAFSRIGDCDSLPFSFLGDFDAGPDAYDLGEYAYLADVVAYYQGSYGRAGVTARDGFNTASILSPFWADPDVCLTGENPLECEVRVNQPSVMLIALGSNDFGQPERFEQNMRVIIDYLLDHGVIPILGTKADNLEGDHQINALIGKLAYEYELPLWNFWLSIQPLDNHGVRDDDNYHPTHPGFGGRPNDFSNPDNMLYGFPWRNLTALQVLDRVMRGATNID